MSLTQLRSRGILDGTISAGDLATGVGGKVLQVVTATDSTQRTTTSSSFVTASNTLSVSITPSSSSNKIFVLVTNGGQADGANAVYTIYRDSTNLGNGNDGMYSAGGNKGRTNTTMSILDSPATTSAITYQVYLRTTTGGNTCYSSMQNVKASITAFEIKG